LWLFLFFLLALYISLFYFCFFSFFLIVCVFRFFLGGISGLRTVHSQDEKAIYSTWPLRHYVFAQEGSKAGAVWNRRSAKLLRQFINGYRNPSVHFPVSGSVSVEQNGGARQKTRVDLFQEVTIVFFCALSASLFLPAPLHRLHRSFDFPHSDS
jgi:hypothetical protein